MYDSGKIITGLVIALAVLTFPVWWNLADGAFTAPPRPEPELAPAAKAAGKCVEPGAVMKTKHMQILDDWRNAVVRDGTRYYVEAPAVETELSSLTLVMGAREFVNQSVVEIPGVTPLRYIIKGDEELIPTGGGKMVEMSLQRTCLQCHTSKKNFCDRCHDYTAVTPFCWECHNEPKEAE
jgi:hypothetical protein